MTKTEQAIRENRTVYTKNVLNAMEVKTSILKSGEQNRKLGGFVTIGKWRGMPLYSLTLEERATCPLSCIHIKDCYGNNMPFAHRFEAGKELEQRLEIELKRLNYVHQFGFVIRLHVLGDFYSLDYISRWDRWLKRFPNMKVYGYTGYNPEDENKQYAEIGKAILKLRLKHKDRFQIRLSNGGDGEFSANSIEDNYKGFTCPEQTNKVPTCADCGLCWTVKTNVNFITH
jgi:hypothetical protein